MAATIQSAAYFKMTVPDKSGVAADLLGRLRDAGVDLLAFSGFPRGRAGQLDFVVRDAANFKAAAKRAGIKVTGPKLCFVIQGEDRPGAIADVLTTLAQRKINVRAMDAACAGEGRYGAILWVRARDHKRAAALLGATGH
jgi:hypothetical protein